MKPTRHVAWVLSLVLLAGCTTTFRPWTLSEINAGMTRADVVRILGEPDYVEMKDGSEFLHYTYRENYNPPLSSDSTYAYDVDSRYQTRQMRRSLKEYRYAVKLVDGRVQDYKELTD